MIRRILLGIGFCAVLGVSLSADAADALLNCPAIATKIPDAFAPTCSHPQTLCKRPFATISQNIGPTTSCCWTVR